MFYPLKTLRQTYLYKSTRAAAKEVHGIYANDYLKHLQVALRVAAAGVIGNTLAESFTWHRTPQGSQFWDDISIHLYQNRVTAEKPKKKSPRSQELTVLL